MVNNLKLKKRCIPVPRRSSACSAIVPLAPRDGLTLATPLIVHISSFRGEERFSE
jgi:hypothetical protein